MFLPMLSFTMLFVLCIHLIKYISGAKILGIAPTPFYSHQSVFQPLWRALSAHGHQITVISTNPMNDPSVNITEIDLSFTYKLIYQDLQIQHVINTESNVLILLKHSLLCMHNMTIEQMNYSGVRELINSDVKFDLVIVEAHVPAWFGFAKKYNCPMITVVSMPAPNFVKRVLGNFNHPVFSHSLNLPLDEEMIFFQRVIRIFFEIFDDFVQRYIMYPWQEKIAKEVLKDPDVNLFEILKNTSLHFVNEIPGFTKMSANIPSVVNFNGIHIKPPQLLPKELLEFVESAPEGVIYFTLGSNVKSSLIPKEKQEILFETFRKLPFRVIWKFEDKVEELPPNVKVMTWAPQQDILRHKNVKLFITQGGLQSIDEAIRFKVPILGMPFFGDQFFNVMRVKSLGIGLWIDFKTITVEVLEQSILEIIDNSTYSKNMEELGAMLGHPSVSTERAVWWVEYVIRHGAAPYFQSPLADMPFYHYYLFDILLFFLIFTTLVIFAWLKLIQILWKFWFGWRSAKRKTF